MNSLTAGDIRVKWQLPSDNGGSPVNGYMLYLNNVLLVDASTQSTLNQYTYTGLSVGQTYLISISAVNNIGESVKASLSLLAASVPQKLQPPTLVSATSTTIQIKASPP
jgi:hypothetical protein